jgi:RNA polymerase sigma-70 factor (ECF subfamily)
VQQVEPTSFHEVWAAHARHVYRFAVFLTGDTTLAEDLTSEAFLRVWAAWDRVVWPTVRSYLFATARNLYLQHLRRTQREHPLDTTIVENRSLAEHTEHREDLQQVMEAMRQLPEIDRTALLLRAEEGFTYAEIAAALKLPEATVKVKIHRARLRLAQMCDRRSYRL